MTKLTTLTAAVMFAVAAPALADRTQVVRVPYGDLDLTKAASIKMLDRRINSALSRVCGDFVSAEEWEWAGIRRCRRDAQTAVMPQLAQARRNQFATNEVTINPMR